MAEKFGSWNKIFIEKYCQGTITAIQMIKRVRISCKFKQLSQKKEYELPSRNKTDSEFILILTTWALHNCLKSKWSGEIAQAQVITTAFIDGERDLLPEIKKNNVKHYQTAIQIIKRIS